MMCMKVLGQYAMILVGHCLATKGFMDKLPDTGGVGVIIGS